MKPFGIETSPLSNRVSLGEFVSALRELAGRQNMLLVVVIAAVGVAISGTYILIFFAAGAPWYFLVAVLLITVASSWRLARLLVHKLGSGIKAQWLGRHNNLAVQLLAEPTGQPGLIFSFGHSKKLGPVLSGERVMFGEYSCSTGSGKSHQTHPFHFARVPVSRKLPHIVIDAKHNNASFGTDLPASFGAAQKLSMGAGFEQHFTTYAPQGYEQDALYVLTPELMIEMTDYAAAFNIEIVDNYLYLFASGTLEWSEPHVTALLTAAERIGNELEDNSERYADARIGDRAANVVAAGGARLKQTVPPLVIIIAVIMVLFVALNVLDFF